MKFSTRLFCILFFLCIAATASYAQEATVKGFVADTAESKPLQHAVVMAVRFSDSTLVGFTRTDSKGAFEITGLPADTYQVVISHPRFGDHTTIMIANKDNSMFDFKKIILPTKTVALAEVTVFGYADAVYYKGDTLVYTADSFKVAKSAVVEDLLKKLPGIKVDENGKIYSQGKAVDQVLVDGDEFFGSDPTIATKNLAASGVESVKVYDKKNDAHSENDDKETLKVMDLQLKEDAKKGHFGKVSAAGGFKDFYEGELLANKFKGRQKISVFLLASNTPRTAFDWRDSHEYGLENDMNFNDDGGFYFYDNQDPSTRGVPRTIKTGFNYNDMLGKKTKIILNYTYYNLSLRSLTNAQSQYFLPDTTYKTNNDKDASEHNNNHSLTAAIVQTVDSFTEVRVESKLKVKEQATDQLTETRFISEDNTLTRSTDIFTDGETDVNDWVNSMKFNRIFRNRDRKLFINYSLANSATKFRGLLQSQDRFFGTQPDSIIDEQKSSDQEKQTHTGGISYDEPLSKKFIVQFAYDFDIHNEAQDKSTMDRINGDYILLNPALSNDFEYSRSIHRGGVRLSYNLKKYSIAVGTRLRRIDAHSENLINGQDVKYRGENILPYVTANYKFTPSSNFNVRYTTGSDQPSLFQLQPVLDNINPNNITIGNPALKPSFNHNINVYYYSYKTLPSQNLWMSVGYNRSNNAITSAVTYDSIGRTITQYVNTNGKFNTFGYLNAEWSLFESVLGLAPYLNMNYSENVNFINDTKNITRQSRPGGGLRITLRPDTSLEFWVEGQYNYNDVSATLTRTSNSQYYSSDYTAFVSKNLPFKMKLTSKAVYNFDQQPAAGGNLHFLIWDASLEKNFLKDENLIISIDAIDMLNERVNHTYSVYNNVISDVTTNVIGRYIMLKAIFKMNSNKNKDE